MNKNYIVIGMVLALVAGMAIGYAGAGSQYSAQLDKAKKAFPSTPTMMSLSGTVKSISGDTIALQTSPSANPFENLPAVREVRVTSATKIIKNVPKDPTAFQKEMADYQAAFQKSMGAKPAALTNLPIPPQSFNETALQISDLKAGDMIAVDAGKDVKTVTSFDAVKITVSEAAAPAAAGVPGGVAPIVNTPPPARTDGGAPPSAPAQQPIITVPK